MTVYPVTAWAEHIGEMLLLDLNLHIDSGVFLCIIRKCIIHPCQEINSTNLQKKKKRNGVAVCMRLRLGLFYRFPSNSSSTVGKQSHSTEECQL